MVIVVLGWTASTFFVSSLAQASNRSTIKSGRWSDPGIWQSGLIPLDSDNVAIASGDTVMLDANTSRLASLTVQSAARFYGGKDTIFVSNSFDGPGFFSADSGTVYFFGKSAQQIGGSVTTFHHLVLALASDRCGPRLFTTSVRVVGDLTIFYDSASLSFISMPAPSTLEVEGNVLYVGPSAINWNNLSLIGFAGDSTRVASKKISYLYLRPLADSSIGKAFLFPRIDIRKPDTTYAVRLGFDSSFNHFLQPSKRALLPSLLSGTDTIINVFSGTLDDSGKILESIGHVRSGLSSTIIHLFNRGRFTTRQNGVFDTTFAPFFLCDSGSAIEFADNNRTDVSFFQKDIIGGVFRNLWLGGFTIAGTTFDTLRVAESLVLELGATLYPNANTGGTLAQQIIHVHGDVLNLNGGESGSTGAGPRGCGMISEGTETWLFDSPHDTCHWSGPSLISHLIVRDSTVLSVRFLDDLHCDSLDITDGLEEDDVPGGGHIIGRIFTGTPPILDDSHPVDSFLGLGLTLRTGTLPFLGRTRVMRTSGYLPKGIDSLNAAQTVLRYYQITPQNDPQTGLLNQVRYGFLPIEAQGVDRSRLNLWRSRDRGTTWSYAGKSGEVDTARNIINFDTTSVGFPGIGNSFYWIASTAGHDVALPVDLAGFHARWDGKQVTLDWHTGSEYNSLGFDIEVQREGRRTIVSSFSSDPNLLSHSPYGGDYYDTLPHELAGRIELRLFETSKDGIRSFLASRILDISELVPDNFSARILLESGSQNYVLELQSPNVQNISLAACDELGREGYRENILVQRGTTRLPLSPFVSHSKSSYLAVQTAFGIRKIFFLGTQ